MMATTRGNAEMDPRIPRSFAHSANSHTPSTSAPTSSPSSSSSPLTVAQQVDALHVYEDAVQEPSLECSNLDSLYYNAQVAGSQRPFARVLREDFCSSG